MQEQFLLIMNYYRHTELVDTHHVSLKTVHNWISSAKKGKIDLALSVINGKTYIARTPGNQMTLAKLSLTGKKYRNHLHSKIIYPTPEFYNLYSRRQILDIISDLKIHGEIPRQYNYFDKGAQNWNNWLNYLESDKHKNILKGTIELIHANLGALDLLLRDYKKVNVIDLGAGNARPVKELLDHLLKQHTLKRYIAIDISPAMLEIAKSNVAAWFNNKVKFEGYIKDISFERFDDLIVDDMLSEDAEKTINLVLLLGGTHLNIREYNDVIRAIYGSMNNDDILLYTDKPDSEASRQYFNFNTRAGATDLSPNHRFILDLLNIDSSLYGVEMGYDTEKRMRYVRIRFKKAITLNFSFTDGIRSVSFEKGDTIIMLRVWHLSSLELISEFDKIGLRLLQTSLTRDREFILTISGVDIKNKAISK